MSHVLIVEDERHIAEGLRFNLTAEGHDVSLAATGASAVEQVLHGLVPFDIVVLDVMLPDQDGFSVAKDLRSSGCFVPILMLTARSRPEDVLDGFEAGADDYLPKPFDLAILLARLNGLLRRRRWNTRDPVTPAAPLSDTTGDVYTFAGRTIDFTAMEVRWRDRANRLTLMECDLLRYLVRNPGTAVSRRAILADVWGLHESTDTRAIDNFIVRLRRYIEDRPSSPQFLLTVRGVGYRFVPDGGV